MKALTPQQQKFAEAYALGNSATEAARIAGYSAKRPDVSGAKLLKNKSVAAEVARIRKESSERTAIDLDWLTEQYVENHRRARSVADFAASNKALETLARLHGQLNEKLKVSKDGEGGGGLTIEIVRFGSDSNSA
jgi:phage terminase small subunit